MNKFQILTTSGLTVLVLSMASSTMSYGCDKIGENSNEIVCKVQPAKEPNGRLKHDENGNIIKVEVCKPENEWNKRGCSNNRGLKDLLGL